MAGYNEQMANHYRRKPLARERVAAKATATSITATPTTVPWQVGKKSYLIYRHVKHWRLSHSRDDNFIKKKSTNGMRANAKLSAEIFVGLKPILISGKKGLIPVGIKPFQ